MNKHLHVSKTALTVFDYLTRFIQDPSYLLKGYAGGPELTKTDISELTGFSIGYTRKLLNSLCVAGYLGYVEIGHTVKLQINPNKYVNPEIAPSDFVVSLYLLHERQSSEVE